MEHDRNAQQGVRPSVSVVVVNWKQPELTNRALDSLRHQALDEPFEIIVVENSAQEPQLGQLRAANPDVLVVPLAHNAGFAGGVNAGIDAANGDVIVLVNNDAVAEKGFLQAGLSRLRAEPDRVAAVAALVVLEGRFRRLAEAPASSANYLRGLDGSHWEASGAPDALELCNSSGLEIAPGVNGYDRDWLVPLRGIQHEQNDHPFGFSGAGTFLRRSALNAVGTFDERFFMYYEDLDLSWRFALKGFETVFEPEAKLVHRHGASSGHSSPLLRFHSMRNRLYTTMKNATLNLVVAVTARTVLRTGVDLARAAVALLTRGKGSAPYLSPGHWLRLWTHIALAGPGLLASRGRIPRGSRQRAQNSFRSSREPSG